METGDAVAVQLNELTVIQLLQHKVAGIVVDSNRGVILGMLEKQLKGRTIVNIRTRMQLVPEDATLVMRQIKQRHPAFCEFFERFVDQSRRTLRPGINHVPGKATGHGRNIPQSKVG